MGGRQHGIHEEPMDGLMIRPQERILLGVIASVDSTRNKCSVELLDITGVRQVEIPVEMMHTTNWARRIPVEGTLVVVGFRPNNIPFIIGYADKRTYNNAREYAEGKSLFRDLVPGEYDTMTPGHAGNWATIRGRLLQHGGAGSLLELDRDELEARIDTSKFAVTLPSHISGVNAQMRFGTVKRTIGEQRDKIIGKEGSDIAAGDPDLQEFYVGVGWTPMSSSGQSASEGPQLAELSLGHIVDKDGKEEKSRASKKDLKLRSRLRIFNTTGTETADAEIDEAGNLYIQLPQTATVGFVTKILGGNFTIQAERGDIYGSAQGDVTFGAGDGLYMGAGQNAILTSNLSTTIGSVKDVSIMAQAGSVDMQGVGVNIGAVKEVHTSAPQVSVSADILLELVSKMLMTITSAGPTVVTAPDIRLGAPAAANRLVLDTFMAVFNGHTHGGVESGGSVTGPPAPPMTPANLTVITKAM